MSIKMKILIPAILLTILVLAAILTSNIIQFSINVDSTLNASFHTASLAALDEINMLKSEGTYHLVNLADERSRFFLQGEKAPVLV